MEYFTIISRQDGLDIELKKHPDKESAIAYNNEDMSNYDPEDADTFEMNRETGTGWCIDKDTMFTLSWNIYEV
jgi:hypothetical protein